jgi:hypothetical protein
MQDGACFTWQNVPGDPWINLALPVGRVKPAEHAVIPMSFTRATDGLCEPVSRTQLQRAGIAHCAGTDRHKRTLRFGTKWQLFGVGFVPIRHGPKGPLSLVLSGETSQRRSGKVCHFAPSCATSIRKVRNDSRAADRLWARREFAIWLSVCGKRSVARPPTDRIRCESAAGHCPSLRVRGQRPTNEMPRAIAKPTGIIFFWRDGSITTCLGLSVGSRPSQIGGAGPRRKRAHLGAEGRVLRGSPWPIFSASNDFGRWTHKNAPTCWRGASQRSAPAAGAAATRFACPLFGHREIANSGACSYSCSHF